MASVKLKKGRDKSIKRKHPWIFSGAIDSLKNIKFNGETVEIISADGQLLGYGSYSSQSQISIRVLSFNPEDKIDVHFFKSRIEDSYNLRKEIIDIKFTNAYRIVNAENDFLPGLIVDKYSDFLVCQFLSAGMEFWKNDIIEILATLFKPKCIYERSDVEVRIKEGLNRSSGNLYGIEPPDLIEIIENNNQFLVNIKQGHKTGFYLDQRDNRNLLVQYSENKNVLNCFSYTGGFSVYALQGNAKFVTNVDTSADALTLSEQNLLTNKFGLNSFENIKEDVFKYLRRMRDSDKKFDIIILDPPKFAESASQVGKAIKGYKDINLLALKLLNKNGMLFTFSCSGHITPDIFSKIIADAANDSGREVFVLKQLSQSIDHIVSTSFPEGLYLKGLLCKVK